MSKIEKHLHEHFASLMEDTTDGDGASSAAAAASSSREPALRDYVPAALDEAFAKVNTVTERSPAHTAGLQQGDLIRNFGWVNKSNHDGLKKVAECVQANEGVSFYLLFSFGPPFMQMTNASTAYDTCQGVAGYCRSITT